MFGIEEKSQETMLRERLNQLEELFEDIKYEYFMMARYYDEAKAQIEELEEEALGREDHIAALEKELELRNASSSVVSQNIWELR